MPHTESVWMEPAETQKLSFREIFEKFFKKVYNYLLGLARDADLAEDLTQETFIRAHRYLDRFNPRKGSYLNWLLSIARNLFYDFSRRQNKITNSVIENTSIDQLVESNTPADVVVDNEIRNRLIYLINDLPEHLYSVLSLRYLENKKSPEIARQLGISERTARRNFVQALDLLKSRLEAESIDAAVLYP